MSPGPIHAEAVLVLFRGIAVFPNVMSPELRSPAHPHLPWYALISSVVQNRSSIVHSWSISWARHATSPWTSSLRVRKWGSRSYGFRTTASTPYRLMPIARTERDAFGARGGRLVLLMTGVESREMMFVHPEPDAASAACAPRLYSQYWMKMSSSSVPFITHPPSPQMVSMSTLMMSSSVMQSTLPQGASMCWPIETLDPALNSDPQPHHLIVRLKTLLFSNASGPSVCTCPHGFVVVSESTTKVSVCASPSMVPRSRSTMAARDSPAPSAWDETRAASRPSMVTLLTQAPLAAAPRFISSNPSRNTTRGGPPSAGTFPEIMCSGVRHTASPHWAWSGGRAASGGKNCTLALRLRSAGQHMRKSRWYVLSSPLPSSRTSFPESTVSVNRRGRSSLESRLIGTNTEDECVSPGPRVFGPTERSSTVVSDPFHSCVVRLKALTNAGAANVYAAARAASPFMRRASTSTISTITPSSPPCMVTMSSGYMHCGMMVVTVTTVVVVVVDVCAPSPWPALEEEVVSTVVVVCVMLVSTIVIVFPTALEEEGSNVQFQC
mmetsp:Transcript_50268/g.96015  ORF Transcript_50268/g.96015 Transcript_50268/m.96015 type:complete len:552 (-) Transcript_50268:1210-2865(-)